MGIEAASIKDKRIIRIYVDSRVRIPEIAVHQARFYRPAVAFEWAQQARYDFVENRWDQNVEFGIMPFSFYLMFEGQPQVLRKENLPTILPLSHLGQVAAVCRSVKSEFAGRGFAGLVQLRQTPRKFVRLRKVIQHLAILA